MSKEPKKQPKPKGHGNYRVCGGCNGFGATVNGKKYTGNKIWTPNKTINLVLQCKTCKGAGWTSAN